MVAKNASLDFWFSDFWSVFQARGRTSNGPHLLSFEARDLSCWSLDVNICISDCVEKKLLLWHYNVEFPGGGGVQFWVKNFQQNSRNEKKIERESRIGSVTGFVWLRLNIFQQQFETFRTKSILNMLIANIYYSQLIWRKVFEFKIPVFRLQKKTNN